MKIEVDIYPEGYLCLTCRFIRAVDSNWHNTATCLAFMRELEEAELSYKKCKECLKYVEANRG